MAHTLHTSLLKESNRAAVKFQDVLVDIGQNLLYIMVSMSCGQSINGREDRQGFTDLRIGI